MVQTEKKVDLTKTMSPWYKIPAIEAFPTSLSIIYLAGMQNHLSKETIAELREIEERLQENVHIAPILQARTIKSMEKAVSQAYKLAESYYVNSGITIWRSLNHDYNKLLKLSQVSSKLIEDLFFQRVKYLEHETFIKSIVGLRVLRDIGKRIILTEEKKPVDKQMPNLTYLNQVVYATFFLWCLLSYLQDGIKKVRRGNLKILAEEIFSCANKAYNDAVQQNFYETEEEKAYWSPLWQAGEVEADLDKYLGNVKTFDSIEDLLKDLHRTSTDEIRTHQAV